MRLQSERKGNAEHCVDQDWEGVTLNSAVELLSECAKGWSGVMRRYWVGLLSVLLV